MDKIDKRFESRLINWKFASALRLIKDGCNPSPTERTKQLVEALALSYGNVGWFEGAQAVIIAHALAGIEESDQLRTEN